MFGQKRIPSREGGVEIVVEELCTRMVAQRELEEFRLNNSNNGNIQLYDRGKA